MDHPNITKFTQCIYDNLYINIVMELVKGITLTDLVERAPGGKLAEGQCQIILRQVLNAMKYFHSRGIVHRDLKTDNIMICGSESKDPQDLVVKMIDFGMSKFSKGGTINLSTYCGTINFMAPEVL